MFFIFAKSGRRGSNPRGSHAGLSGLQFVGAPSVDWVFCRMFNRAIRGQTVPKYVSPDHDPLYRFDQWQANLRVLDMIEILRGATDWHSTTRVSRLDALLDQN